MGLFSLSRTGLSSPSISRKRKSEDRGRKTRFEQLEPRAMLAGDAILHWNGVALNAVAADHTYSNLKQQVGPTRASRALAIVHVAMYDAINSIKSQLSPYYVYVVGAKGANIDAAVGQAARDTLVALYGRQRGTIDAALKSWLAKVPDGKSENLGLRVGRIVARAILNSRTNDGANGKSDYKTVNLLGHHQPDPLNPNQGFLDPHWGDVTTFGIPSSDKFVPPKPPKLTSAQYAAAYKEVMQYGGDGITTPTLRTQEQTEIGTFWAYDGVEGLCAPPRLYNQIAVTIAKNQKNNEYENARMLALMNVAMADASIVGWDCKFTDDFWRPVIGIRNGDADGNAKTVGDPNWTPLGAPASNQTFPNDFTPPFPAYVSGHAIIGAAAFRTIARYYGTDNIAFSFTSDEFNGTTTGSNGVARPEITRHFTKLSQASEENGQSRIYLGIHWKFDKVEGIRAGNAIANYVYTKMMKPMRSALTPVSMMVTMSGVQIGGKTPQLPAKIGSLSSATLDKKSETPPQVIKPVLPVNNPQLAALQKAYAAQAKSLAGNPAAQEALDRIFARLGGVLSR